MPAVSTGHASGSSRDLAVERRARLRRRSQQSENSRTAIPARIVKGIAEGTIEWEQDSDFGYLVASRVPGLDSESDEILQPRKLYDRQNRNDEYKQIVERLKTERREYMTKWEGLNPEISEAVS